MKKDSSHINEENFMRYLENQMTEKERNLFEKEIQKNPFEAEAIEGFLNLNPNQIKKDLGELKAKIHTVKRKINYRYWAAAASFLLIVTSGLIWFQLNDNQAIQELAENKTVQNQDEKIVTSDKQEESVLVNKTPQTQISENNFQVKSKVNTEKGEVIYEAKKSKETEKSESNKLPETVSRKKILIVENTLEETDVETAQNIRVVHDISQVKDSNVTFMNKDLKQEHNKPNMTAEYNSFRAVQTAENTSEVAGAAPVIEILPEKETTKSTSKNRSSILADSKVQPEIGMQEFEKYLKRQALLPNDFPKRKEVIKLVLAINSRGKITEIQNKNKGDSLIFEKTKEIITNGPKWKPEIKNGIPIESEIELKIIFRK